MQNKYKLRASVGPWLSHGHSIPIPHEKKQSSWVVLWRLTTKKIEFSPSFGSHILYLWPSTQLQSWSLISLCLVLQTWTHTENEAGLRC